MPTHDEYADYMAQLQLLAQQDLAGWWANTDGMAPPLRMDTMREAFDAVQRTYGEQAAYAAAEHLFLNRQLDEALAGEEFPEVANPAEYEQARAGFNWATKEYRRSFDPALVAVAREKLDGVLVRLVAQPAHETEIHATLKAGTGFARIPEPGACTFCLMLASRGAAYSRETVVGLARFHDNCRCVGIEVKDDSQLPQINRDLEKLWKEAGNKAKFDELINSRRAAAGGKPTDVNAKAVLRWKQDVGKLDRSIPLNHVMQWKIRRRRIQGGHKHEHMIDMQAAIRRGDAEVGDRTKTFFPKMSDSELISWLSGPEGVQAVIEDPDVVSERGRYGRTLRKEVVAPHGRRIDLAVEVADAPRLSEYSYQIVTLYPERGDGIQALGNDGNVAEVRIDG
ncbi:hypothetical protein [uncultured Corynebacterium sp.]|uniref:VG15 protein n=1 Tax=uncultured Corynebacterium sp. TaxID=159447 RepID=UPI00260312C1|nr:hypothetical protein [uncultured Corynebacterium sp.]